MTRRYEVPEPVRDAINALLIDVRVGWIAGDAEYYEPIITEWLDSLDEQDEEDEEE
jgi:hypothetical protein